MRYTNYIFDLYATLIDIHTDEKPIDFWRRIAAIMDAYGAVYEPKEMRTRYRELINEHEIMQQAYAQANEVVTMASRQAQEILDNATTEANSVRVAAMQYMDDMLTHLGSIISSSTHAATSNYESLIGSLNHYRDIIEANRNELHPAEDELSAREDGIETTDSAEDIDII